MEDGLVTYDGYPIGDLYYLLDYEAEARGMNLHSLEFRNRRQLFLDAGIPACRIQTVTPLILSTTRAPVKLGIPTDYDLGINLPDVLVS